MAQTDLVYELLKADLSAPRVLLEQVVNYINDHYGYSGADFPKFFEEKYSALEDYEVDLIFSPQYTPAEHNRLEYIPALGFKALQPEEVKALKNRLNEEGLQTVLSTPEEQAQVQIRVHEVFIDRYVGLLKLDQKLPDRICEEIQASVPQVSRNEMNLLGRDEAWQSESRQNILLAFLRAFKARDTFAAPKVSFLTNFVRTYRPNTLADVERQLDSLIESCNKDMENVSGRGFHDEYLKSLYAQHAGDNRTGTADDGIWHHYRRMMDMAHQLKDDLKSMEAVAS